MEKIILSRLLKEYMLEPNVKGPFEDAFDMRQFVVGFQDFLIRTGNEKLQVKDSGEFEAIFDLNDLYNAIMDEIESLISQLNSDSISILRQYYALSNFETMSVSERVIETMEQDDKNVPKEVQESYNVKIKNVLGDEVSVQNAMDMNIDTSNELIRILYTYEFERNTNIQPLSTLESLKLLQKLKLHCNLLFAFKDAFNYFKHEFSRIEKHDTQIKFKNDPEYYFFLKKAGNERFESHLYEHWQYGFQYFQKETKESIAIIKDGKASFRLTGRKIKNPFRAFTTAVFTSYFFPYHLIKIPALDNVTAAEVLFVVSELQFLFDSFKSPEIIAAVIKDQDSNGVPYYIQKKELISHICKLTDLKEKTVVKIISHFSRELSSEFNIWKTPFVSWKDSYFFNLGEITHLNCAYILDNILRSCLSKEKNLSIFIKYLQTDILKNDKSDYVFNEVKIELPENLKTCLIYELDTIFLIVEPCVIRYPLGSTEYEEATLQLSVAADRLDQQKNILQQYLKDKGEKKAVGVVAANYPFLSGMMINDSFVLDSFLLKNYFSTGMYQRGVVVSGNGEISTRELGSYQYYKDSYEMSENFLDFCARPAPITNLILNYDQKEYVVGPKEAIPQVIQDGIEKLPYKDVLSEHIGELNELFSQLYYFGSTFNKDEKPLELIQRRIDFLLPQIIGSIAFQRDSRLARLKVLTIFKKIEYRGLAYLVSSFAKALVNLNTIKIEKEKEWDRPEYKEEEIKGVLEQIIEGIARDNKQVGFSSLKIEHTFDGHTIQQVLEFLLNMLALIEQKKYSPDELESFLMLISIFSVLAKNVKEYKRFLPDIFLNFLDALNFNFQHQLARNVAEEILEYSFQNEQIPTIGWLCLYKCFLKQKNIYDAAFYGLLFVNCLTMMPSVDEEIISKAIYNSMLFFRDYNYKEIEEALFRSLQKLPMSEYEKQKITLSYYAGIILNHRFDTLEKEINEIESYLSSNIESICKYHAKGATPWLSLLYNFRNIKQRGYTTVDLESIEEFIRRLEKEIDPTTLDRIRAQFFPIPGQSKQILKDALISSFEAFDFDDVAFEFDNLTLMAQNVASMSMDPIDLEGLCLSGLIINDQSLTFPSMAREDETAPFLKKVDAELIKRLDNYGNYILSKIKLSSGQALVWVFDLFERVYMLRMDSQMQPYLMELSDWSLNETAEWLDSIDDFNFNGKNGEYFINEQERDYISISKQLKFATLPILNTDDKIFLYTSLKLSAFPHNLINIDFAFTGGSNFVHEYAVEEFIRTEKSDFISLHKPITNVISLEWFIEHGKPLEMRLKEFSIEAWMPTADEDFVLTLSLEKLRPLLHEKYGCEIDTALIPKKQPGSTINVFMAHGGKGVEGFRTIYTKQVEGHAIERETGIEQLFGNGTIAVVFVCHSASISQKGFSQRLTSLSHHILQMGYKAVIAPAWALNPDIVPVWLETFLDALRKGCALDECVLLSNRKVAKGGFDEYGHGFYTPTGWAAMHLYGNPNIKFIE